MVRGPIPILFHIKLQRIRYCSLRSDLHLHRHSVTLCKDVHFSKMAPMFFERKRKKKSDCGIKQLL